jgi:hypothetical protein
MCTMGPSISPFLMIILITPAKNTSYRDPHYAVLSNILLVPPPYDVCIVQFKCYGMVPVHYTP